MWFHILPHRPLRQLSSLINVQALSEWPPSFEWHFRVQAEITSTPSKLTWTSFPYQRCSPAVKYVCICLCACLSACLCQCMCVCAHVCEISFLYRFGGLIRAWDSSPQQRVNLRHLLCTSSIFLDSWHFTSWTNCQLSKLNFRNDMLKFTPHTLTPPPQTPPPLWLTLPLPSAYTSVHLPTCRHRAQCFHPRQSHTQPCTCMHIHLRGQMKFSLHPLHSIPPYPIA